MAGIHICKEVLDSWSDIKMAKNNIRYMIFKLDDKKENVILETTKLIEESCHQDLLDEIPQEEPRYIAVNLDFTNKEGATRNKLVWIYWCPMYCKVKDKMVSAATYKDVTRKCTGGTKCLEIQDMEDLQFEALKESLGNIK